MHIQDLEGRDVCILGFGKEGRSAFEALKKYAPKTSVTIADNNRIDEPPRGIALQTGDTYMEGLDRFDVIIKSPGIPPSLALAKVAKKITNATQIFFDTIADSGALIVGVTGSKGKSTTSSLLHAMLVAGKKRSFLVGNIGMPALDYLDRAKKGVIFVHELSSYQLMDMRVSPHIAVITSIFPEHLDYHGSFAAYLEAKSNIARFQRESDAVIFPAHDAKAVDVAKCGRGRKIPFSPEDAPLALEDTKLIGQHNLSNIAAAWTAAKEFGVSEAAAIAAAKAFNPLPHRLQSLGTKADIEWIDDAISTTPDSAIAALDALGENVATIILGGTDRGIDFQHLGTRIKASSLKTVILFPGSGPRIKAAIEAAKATVQFFDAASMDEAVTIAKAETPAGKIVLLSTASPSYNMFKNFEEKGERFAACVKKL